MRFHLGNGVTIDERTQNASLFQPVTDLQPRYRPREFFSKGIINTALHIKPVGADAGLAVVAELGNQRPFDSRVEISVIKYDEGRVAAEFQPEFLDRRRALAVKMFSRACRAGEGEETNIRACGQHAADFCGRTRHDAEKFERQARALGENGEGDGRKRRLRCGFQHHRAAGSERRADLAGNHGIGEIPRRDGRDDADRLAQNEDALVGLMTGNRLTIDPARLFGKPLDEACPIGDFTFGFRERFSLFQRQDHAEIVPVFHDEPVPRLQDRRTLAGCAARPCFLGNHGSGDSRLRFRCAKFGNLPDDFPRRGIADRRRLAVIAADPAAGHGHFFTEKRGVIQMHGADPSTENLG